MSKFVVNNVVNFEMLAEMLVLEYEKVSDDYIIEISTLEDGNIDYTFKKFTQDIIKFISFEIASSAENCEQALAIYKIKDLLTCVDLFVLYRTSLIFANQQLKITQKNEINFLTFVQQKSQRIKIQKCQQKFLRLLKDLGE